MDTDPRSDDPPDDPWFVRCAAWIQPTPVELLGLTVLLVGALTASAVLWWSATTRTSEMPGGVETAVDDPATTDPSSRGPAMPAGPSAENVGPVAGEPRGPDEPGPPDDPTQSQEAAPDEVTVHVTGAVAHPGLATLPLGARVGDAVTLAGGLASDAAVEHVNLARTLSDGEHVHVPRQGETPSRSSSEQGGAHAAEVVEPSAERPLDLNRATAQQLEALPGIGPAKAQAIVAHREEQGPFEVPGDLRAVTGIGERTFQSLAELVTVR